MKLDRVQIHNFRSIADITVDFDPACRILVGINESGKSNILAALRLLDQDHDPVRKDDLREALPDENPIEKSFVRFIFRFEKEESDELVEAVYSKILAKVKNPNLVSFDGKNKTVKAFCVDRKEGLHSINILDGSKSFSYWKLRRKYKFLPGWKKPTSTCPPDYKVELKGEQYTLSEYTLIRASDFPEVPDGYLEDTTITDLAQLTGGIITNIVEENLPDTLFWEYDEENLLPSAVKIEEFSNNPDSCIPLQNMFTLAGIDDIKAGLDDAKAGTNNQFQNYLNRIAKKSTNHFRNVWKEYRNIEFSLKLNADQIIPGVKEKNVHDFARRSDGFRRFVTFLLMVSVNVKTDDLFDTLLLIDEPDTSLHPSGARYLRDELIRISKTNYVVYSTHSIFMIDSGDLSRHYIVKKKNEVTSIESAKDSNIADEEVLYNALGHSVFAILKEKNLIFEGWKDKRLFQVALEKGTAGIKKKYRDIGICHAKGVGTIKTITPMIELANRKCLIVSDSDKPAKEQKKQYRKAKGYGEWKNYQDIDPAIEAITGEDFVKNDFIVKQVKVVLKDSSMPIFNETLPDKGKLLSIYRWLTGNGMTQEQAQATITKIKDSIFEKLKPQYIESKYTNLLKNIPI